MIQRINAGAPEGGKTAPDKSHNGIKNRFIIAWNPWGESIRKASRNPKPVNANDSKNITTTSQITDAMLKEIPTNGASNRNISPCMSASVVPPRIFPSTSANRPTGATSTACRNPSRRSSMIEIVENIAVNNSTRTIVPPKKYSKYPCPSGADGALNDLPSPDPSNNQNTNGVPRAPTMRLVWRKNRTISRHQSVSAGRRKSL